MNGQKMNITKKSFQNKRFILGIDIGTSSAKGILIDQEGKVMATTSQDYPTCFPLSGYCEQNPEDWFKSVISVVRKIIYHTRIDPNQVEGISFCGTAHTLVLLDGCKKVIRPAILWTDQRSNKEVDFLIKNYQDKILETSFNQPSCTWTLPQILWVKRNELDNYNKIRHFLISKDYIVYRLTGNLVTDIGNAASTLMLDARTSKWSSFLIELSSLKAGAFPKIIFPQNVAGNLTKTAAKKLGLHIGVKVITGTLDSASELIGVGAINPEQGMVRLGTAGGIMVVSDRPMPNEGILTYPHPVSPYWYFQAGTNSFTSSLQWLRSLLNIRKHHEENLISYSEMDQLAEKIIPGCDGLLFHPYLIGERAPYWDPKLRGSFTGLAMEQDFRYLIRSVMEGTSFSILDCFEFLSTLGITLKEIRIGGGGTNSILWCQILSDMLGKELMKSNTNASVYGAALIGAVSQGFFKNLKEAVNININDQKMFYPNLKNHEIYLKLFKIYKQRYNALKTSYRYGI